MLITIEFADVEADTQQKQGGARVSKGKKSHMLNRKLFLAALIVILAALFITLLTALLTSTDLAANGALVADRLAVTGDSGAAEPADAASPAEIQLAIDLRGTTERPEQVARPEPAAKSAF